MTSTMGIKLDSTESVRKNQRMPKETNRACGMAPGAWPISVGPSDSRNGLERKKRYKARPKSATSSRKESRTGAVKNECWIG